MSLKKFLFLILILIAFSLRLLLLDSQELRGDEAFGYFFSQHTYPAIIQNTLDLQEPHPVASYFVQKAWMVWAGDNEFALRFISVWFSTLAVALLYRMARNFKLGSYTALIAMALMTISPYAIWHAQDARMYSMSLALTLASTALAVWFVQSSISNRLRWAITYITISWLALHTHYFAGFVIVAQNLIVIALIYMRYRETGFLRKNGSLSNYGVTRNEFIACYEKRAKARYFVTVLNLFQQVFHNRRRIHSADSSVSKIISTWLVTQVLLALLYLPWLIRAWPTLTNYTGNGESPPLWTMVWRSVALFAVGESLTTLQRMSWGILAIGVIILGTIWLSRRQQRKRRVVMALSLYLWIPLAITWYSALARPIFDERYLIAAAPPFYLLLAMVSQQKIKFSRKNLVSRVLPVLLACILLIGTALSLHNHYTNSIYSKTRGWRELATSMDALSSALPTDQVRLVQNYPDPTLWYYYRGPVSHLVLPPAAHDLQAAQREVAALIEADVQRVILAQQSSLNWDGDAIARNALLQYYQLVQPIEIGSWQVETFVRSPRKWQAVDVFFENGVKLEQAVLSPRQIIAGGQLVLHLKWNIESEYLNGTEKVFIHLINAAGELIAQNDQPLGAITGSTSPELIKEYGILIPDQVSGEYRIWVGLYDPSQAGAPRIVTMDGADFIEIETLSAAKK